MLRGFHCSTTCRPLGSWPRLSGKEQGQYDVCFTGYWEIDWKMWGGGVSLVVRGKGIWWNASNAPSAPSPCFIKAILATISSLTDCSSCCCLCASLSSSEVWMVMSSVAPRGLGAPIERDGKSIAQRKMGLRIFFIVIPRFELCP